jgi:hypothetical protein
MILTKAKKEFAINKSIELIKKCDRYELSQMTMIRDFKWYIASGEYISLHYTKDSNNWVISKMEIKRGSSNQILTIQYDNESKLHMDRFEREMMEMVKTIDDRNFKKMFPEWDPIQDRDIKLKDLLDDDGSDDEPVMETPKKKSKFTLW